MPRSRNTASISSRWPGRENGPRHRPRRGDPPHHPHPLAQDEEQPRPHRRTRRRQDRHRRGPRPAHPARRRARGAEGQDHLLTRYGRARGRGEVPRRIRGAPQGRAQRGEAGRRSHHPLHRRTPHIVGAGKTEGAMDAGNLLKPMLARGELHCIGATTLDEYRKHIEKDAALERRFQPVAGRPADGRGCVVDPARPQGALRAAPRRAYSGQRARERRHAVQPLHQRPLFPRQGHRPDGRGVRDDPHRDGFDAAGTRRAHPQSAAARNRGDRPREGKRRSQQAPARPCGRNSPRPASRRKASSSTGKRKRRPSRRRASCARKSRPRASRWRKPSAPTT
jgi:hypothetical protein